MYAPTRSSPCRLDISWLWLIPLVVTSLCSLCDCSSLLSFLKWISEKYMASSYMYNGLCHAKRSWVVVIPKEGWERMAAPILLLVWHRIFRIFFFLKIFNFFYFLKSIFKIFFWNLFIFFIFKNRCHTNRMYGMTMTQDITDLNITQATSPCILPVWWWWFIFKIHGRV